MPRNELVFACRFSNKLGPIEEVCTKLNLGGEFYLRPIEDFGFSFPESAEGVLVAELTFAAGVNRTGLQEDHQFFPGESIPVLERSSSVIVLVRTSPDSSLVDRLIEAGFSVAGSIHPGATLAEREIQARLPVASFVKGPVPAAIIVGRANANLLAQARALGECGVAVFCILTRDEPPIVARSCRYISKVFDCRGHSDESVANHIKKISELTTGKPVIYTGGDLDIGLLSRIWELIKDIVVAPNDPMLSNKLTDKKAQIEKVESAGITVPKSYVIESMADFNSAVVDCSFPIICKPTELVKKGSFVGKTFVTESEMELRKRMEHLFAGGGASVLLQEYVPGGDDCIMFAMASCDKTGNTQSALTGRKLMDDGRGCIGLGETVYSPRLRCTSEKAFRALGAGGLMAVEFKTHEVTGDLYYIEANLRAENCGSLAQAAGLNLSVSTFLSAIGYSGLYSPLGHRKATWMDASLVLLSMLRKPPWARAKKHDQGKAIGRGVLTDALWASDDPAPAIVWYALKSFALTKRVIKSAFARFK